MKGLVFAILASLVFASPALARGGPLIFVYTEGSGPMRVPDSKVGNYANIKKIGILSAIGTDLDVRPQGGNAVRHNAAAWKIDDLALATLKKYLNTKYELSDLPFDGQAIAAINGSFFKERDTLKLLATYTNPGVDAYLIIRPANSTLPGAPGLGIEVNAKNEVLLWANFEIDLIDAHRLTYLAKGYAQIQDQEGMDPAFSVSQLPISPSSVLLGFQSGAANRVTERVKKELEDLVPNAIVSTLRSLKMGAPLPPVGDHSIAAPADADLMKHLHSVAIVSVIGQSLNFVNPGVGFFVKKSEVLVPVADSGIDDAAEAVAHDVLAKHYVVKSISVDKAAISTAAPVVAGQSLPSFSGLTRTNDVDAYIVIVKALRSEAPYAGLGVLHITPVVNHTTSVFADYAIVVVDARTLTAVAGSTAAKPITPPCSPTDFTHAAQTPPLLECEVDDNFWPGSGDALSPKQMAQIRGTVLNLLSGSIPQTLFRLGLDQPDQASATTGSLAGSAN